MIKKEKIILFFIFLAFFIIFFHFNTAYASNSYYEYVINNYNVDIVVNENNTLDIKETIDVNFNVKKHGIYRYIPIKNKIIRLDGTTSSNVCGISNIEVNENFTTYIENSNKIIQIGDEDTTLIGKKRYIISYTYDLGVDALEDADELYYNIIGDGWDVPIENVTFKITMPKEFNESLLGFSSGSYGSTNSQNVIYNVENNVISGNLIGKLLPYEALTVRLELPEGYFSRTYKVENIYAIVVMCICTFLVGYTFILWKKYGKDEKVIETVEFYPPDNLNSAELQYIFSGKSYSAGIISLLIYLANGGYLKIDNIEKQGVFKKFKTFQITKLKEYDGTNEAERIFFNGLFESSNIITSSDLQCKFYITISDVANELNKMKNKIFDKKASQKGGLIIGFIIFITIITFIKPIIDYGDVFIDISLRIQMYMLMYVVWFISCIIMIIFKIIMPKRTEYGNKMLGRIRGFKRFLEKAEKSKLEALVNEDPKYFYNILPYTYALGVSDKWMKQFETIAVEPPDWYDGYDYFDMIMFSNFMNDTMKEASTSMISSPSSSDGGSGGGFSGGGSGGGGGGSW